MINETQNNLIATYQEDQRRIINNVFKTNKIK